VADAVKELVALDIDPAFVREETLKKKDNSRDTFVMFIDELQTACGFSPKGSEDFARMMSAQWSCLDFKTIGKIRDHYAN
jgi:hypothetical protein